MALVTSRDAESFFSGPGAGAPPEPVQNGPACRDAGPRAGLAGPVCVGHPPGGGEPHGYDEFMASVDALVIGRKTYEVVLAFDTWPYGAKPVFVLSGQPLVSAPVGASVERRGRYDDPEDPIYYVVMHDPEGNEFCVS